MPVHIFYTFKPDGKLLKVCDFVYLASWLGTVESTNDNGSDEDVFA